MLQKFVWVLFAAAFLFSLQAVAGVPAATTSPHTAVRNPQVPFSTSNPYDNVDSVIYREDFESGMNGWTSVDVTNTGIKWHIDSFNAYQGNSWWCGDPLLGGYDNHWLQYLESPVLDFTGLSNPVLTFMMYYAVEPPGGEPPPYDGWDGCNVWGSINGGGTWFVLTPTAPAYNCQNLYSFGQEWGMGPGIAGWGGSSGGWVNASFNLAGAAGHNNVKIRFAFASDPAYCTVQNPSLYGFFVDNVLITAGSTTVLQNNADGIAIPGPFTFSTGGAAGDYWELQTGSYHSANHAMLCRHGGHYNLQDALVSPWLDIPTGTFTAFKFWLWCYMLDFDGDGNNSLEDYYHVEVSTDDIIWNDVFYDYGDVSRPGGALIGWDDYLPGDPYNGNIYMDLSSYAGQQIKLRWRVITDDNDDGGIGDGLYIDDVELFTTGYQNDVAAEKLHVPMPTSVYLDTIHCSVVLRNVGIANQGQVPSFYRINYGTAQPLLPWVALNSGEFVTKNFNWVTPNPGNYFFDAYTSLASDENRSNDTSKAGLVELTAANVLEFGYDNRQYTYAPSIYYFNFEQGEGAYIRYTPMADGITANLNAQNLKVYFQDTGTIRVHIYEAGTATTPGAEVTHFDHAVTQVYPTWQLINISNVPYLQNSNTNFWVWYEVLNSSGAPHLLGWNENIHGEGHFFANFGSGMQPSPYDFFARVVFQPVTGVESPETPSAQPKVFALFQNSPNPFNPTTSITFSLARQGAAKLSVFDLMGREIRVLANGTYSAGEHTVTFDASDLASGLYLYRLEADGKSLQNKMLLLK